MSTALFVLVAFAVGYFMGHKMGVVKTLIKVQGLIQQMQDIEKMMRNWDSDWNEDRL
jgi:hypothetical protein